MTVHPITLHSE